MGIVKGKYTQKKERYRNEKEVSISKHWIKTKEIKRWNQCIFKTLKTKDYWSKT